MSSSKTTAASRVADFAAFWGNDPNPVTKYRSAEGSAEGARFKALFGKDIIEILAQRDRLLTACQMLVSAMEMQEGRESGAFEITQPNALAVWREAKTFASKAIEKASG